MDRKLGQLLQSGKVSVTNAGNVISPEWFAHYGVYPGDFKILVDVGFVAELKEDGSRNISGSVNSAVHMTMPRIPRFSETSVPWR